MSDEWLTTAEAARRLNVNSSRVRQLILAGRLPAEKLGHVHMIRAADVAAFSPRKTGRPRHAGLSPSSISSESVPPK